MASAILPGSTSVWSPSGGVIRRPSVTDHSTSGSSCAWATSRTMRMARGSSGVSIEMIGLPASISSFRLSDFMASA